MKGSKVCVVGGGAVGLSVALYLAKESERKEEKIEITIIAESFLENTTSYGSGGLWEPYKVDGTPDELVNAWGKVTFDFMLGLLADPEKKVASGVQMLTAFQLYDTEEEMIIPTWKDIVFDFKILNIEELNNLETLVPKGVLVPVHKKFKYGFSFKTITADQKYYLKYMTDELKSFGVKFEQKTIESIDDFSEEFDVVVNCCGIQGSKVANDSTECFPIRGQVVRVRTREAPMVKNIWFFGTSYVIPNIDTIVCGGTGQINDWNTVASSEDTETIMGDLGKAFPAMEGVPVAKAWAGLRPARTPLRLDSTIKHNDGNKKEILIAHCYGHGGSGITLCWGCAEDIVVNHILPFLSSKKTE